MDDTAHSAIAVANTLLRRARVARRLLSPTQLHELVYCAQGVHLATIGLALIDSAIAAYRGGVFVPALRAAGCWGDPVVDGLIPAAASEGVFPNIDGDRVAMSTLNYVWQEFGLLSRYDLCRFALAADGPWGQTWEQAAPAESCTIPDAMLSVWFAQRIAARGADLSPPGRVRPAAFMEAG
jgi:uncharacterized phage-associated protein